MFTREFLEGMRRRALRKRVWYSALDRIERGIVSLTCRLVESVRSAGLGIELVKIMVKLKEALKSGFVRHMESFGLREVRKVVAQAVSFGSKVGEFWVRDNHFARYIAFMDINKPTGWGIS